MQTIFRTALLGWLLLLHVEVNAEQSLLSLYKHFHANPELSFKEQQTSARVAKELRNAGYKVTENIGGYGVVALYKNGTGPVLMLRMDMDALPVVENTGLAYASTKRSIEQTGQEVGVMHACGHDAHMTVVIGVARQMIERKDEWRGTLMVIAQPAEERGAGAKAMLKDGLFKRFPEPNYNLSLHVASDLAAGKVGYVAGWALANVDSVDMTIHGVGGHGAYPHNSRDPIVLAAAIIMDLQTLVSREIPPIEPGVITVGSIHAGAKHNIIPDRAELQITVRSYSDAVRNKLLSGIKRIALNQAKAMNFPKNKLPKVTIKNEYTPAMWNDPELVERSVRIMKAVLGAKNVEEVSQEMGGEDFSRYGKTKAKIPSFMFRLGSISQKRFKKLARKNQLPSLHSPFYYPEPKQTIDTGVKAMTAVSLDLLKKS